ncbi:MAG: hypothetical protein IJ177_00945 [Fibrobacter sp.]|uniref:FISUMP domain-containing protein n=1 Tax=Fibrobacter sp. TaxID=35828 RepID=UPI0025BD01C2|nr:FISUMP domain-containing protein [Fibrobacter sp.]MBQ9224744.1 hypothetical protein [Fibrobacter sp.]
MRISRKIFAVIGAISFGLATTAFAQPELREAIDAGDIATAKKIVKKGAAEEIYCGKLSPEDAVKVYEKIFKAMPDQSFNLCPAQFSYGYGTKVCSNAKAMNACTEVISYLLMEGENGNVKALDALESVTKVALKTKAFAKPVKVPVDTSLWVACPKKKGKAREACIEDCLQYALNTKDSVREATCETNPEHYVDTTIKVTVPSPLYEKLRTGLLEGYWKTQKTTAEKYSKLMKLNAKALSIPDSEIVDIAYVARWADKHKADSTALPGGELFRFCTSWQPAVDSILAEKDFATRCPVFEIFEDGRDGQKYKVKEINGTRWFVQNLNFAVEEKSMCYDREDDNCKTYGRLYTHEAALAACPEGTHLATDDDWKMLEIYAGGANTAAEKLRSNGSDDYAFTAMFGGYANKNGISVIQGEGAYFWTGNDVGDGRGVARSMFSTDKEVSTIPVDKGFWLSVRCVVNN